MTCGGDCPGLNPVIRAATIAAIRRGWTVFGIEDSMQGLIDLNYRSPNGNFELSEAIVADIVNRGGTILGSDNHSDPFRYPSINENGQKIEVDVSRTVIQNMKKLNLDGLIMVGGDGSMAIGNKLRKLTNFTLPIVGVPKTIDNDIFATDYPFGFNTAVQTITEAIDKIQDTARSHDRTIIVEVMGRDAGWLALYGGIASGSHVIIVPEIPYDVAKIIAAIKKRETNASPFSVIVIAEGSKSKGGSACYLGEKKPGEMIRYGGAGDKLREEIEGYALQHKIPVRETRVSVLGYIQRGGNPTNFDRILGTRFGEFVVTELLAKKQFGYISALRGTEIVAVTFDEACSKQKRLSPDDQLILTAKNLGICFGDDDVL